MYVRKQKMQSSVTFGIVGEDMVGADAFEAWRETQVSRVKRDRKSRNAIPLPHRSGRSSTAAEWARNRAMYLSLSRTIEPNCSLMVPCPRLGRTPIDAPAIPEQASKGLLPRSSRWAVDTPAKFWHFQQTDDPVKGRARKKRWRYHSKLCQSRTILRASNDNKDTHGPPLIRATSHITRATN